MKNLTLAIAKNLVLQTWDEAAGKKKITSRHLLAAIKKRTPSRTNEVDKIYKCLKPFIMRGKKLNLLAEEDLKIEDSIDLKREKKRRAMQQQVENSGYTDPYK